MAETYNEEDMDLIAKLRECIGFEWDEWNRDKNWILHKVRRGELEEAFFNQPLVASDDAEHSVDEERYYLLGQTNRQRLLFVVFTLRQDKIRIISGRDMTKREREVYRSL